ncbi:MAG: hypothetical protein JO189_08755 [Deltaproteobacteria bacterium]|nr:hypothetical protein [Deltaproteobacteria bacterium]
MKRTAASAANISFPWARNRRAIPEGQVYGVSDVIDLVADGGDSSISSVALVCSGLEMLPAAITG